MKPLYMWGGGKNKMIPKYLQSPGLPTTGYDTYVEPFFGGGAMMLWVYKNCPEVKHYILNDIKTELVEIYTAIKTDVEQFIARMDELQTEYLSRDYEGRREFYYTLREEYCFDFEKWNKTTEAATLYTLMKTGFNGLWQINKSSNNRFGTAVGLCKQKGSIYNEALVREWHQFLQVVTVSQGDWYDACKDISASAFYFMDPPYRDSFTQYGESFTDENQIELINFCDTKAAEGNLVYYCNRNSDDGFFETNRKNLSMKLYPITYTLGRRKKESDGNFTAKKAEEVLLHSPITDNFNNLFDIV